MKICPLLSVGKDHVVRCFEADCAFYVFDPDELMAGCAVNQSIRAVEDVAIEISDSVAN